MAKVILCNYYIHFSSVNSQAEESIESDILLELERVIQHYSELAAKNNHNVDYLQGFHLGEPMHINDLLK